MARRYAYGMDPGTLARSSRRQERKAQREERARLKAEIAERRRSRKDRIRQMRELCRQNRDELRAKRKADRIALIAAQKRERQELRESARAAIVEGRATCRSLTAEARQKGDIERARLALEEYRRHLALLRLRRRQAREEEAAQRARHRRDLAARISESDDEVRANIRPELASFFDRVKRQIKGSPHKSRTERFLEYVEENPDEYVTHLENQAADVAEESEAEWRERQRAG